MATTTEVSLEIVNPIARASRESAKVEAFAPAPRLDRLDGKTIGLFWNGKAHGGVALERIKHNLARRYGDVKFRDYYGAFGSQLRHASAEQIEAMARECDAVIGTTAD
jgi:hypothetical protein